MEELNGPQLVLKIKSLMKDSNVDQDEVDDAVEWFCFKYNPKSKLKLIQADAKALNDLDFMALLLDKAATKYFPEIYFEIFHILSCVQGGEANLVQGATLSTVVMLMAKDDKNIKSIRYAAKGLANVASTPDIRNFIAKTRVLQKLIEMLNIYKKNEVVLVDVLNAITNIVFKSQVSKKAFILNKGIEPILEIVANTKSQSLINQAFVTLRNLVGSASLQELQRDLILHEIIKQLQENQEKTTLHSLWMITLMASRSPETKNYIIEQGLVSHVLKVIGFFKTSVKIQEAAAASLKVLTKNSAVRNQISQQRGVYPILASLAQHQGDPAVKSGFTRVLKRLMFQKEIRDSFGIPRLPNGSLDLRKFGDVIDDAMIASQAQSRLKSNRRLPPKSTTVACDKDKDTSPVPVRKSAPKPVETKPKEPAVATKPTPTATLQDLPVFPYAEIIKRKDELDKTQLPMYLSDAEFQNLFKIGKADFIKLPAWKQTAEKKKHNLF